MVTITFAQRHRRDERGKLECAWRSRALGMGQRGPARKGNNMDVRIVSTTCRRARATFALVALAFAAMTASAQTVDTSASYVLVNRNSGKVVTSSTLPPTTAHASRSGRAATATTAAVAVRGLGRRLLPVEVTSFGQGARRLPVVHRRECADRAVDGPERHQPAIPAGEFRQRVRPADQPPQQQGALRAGRLDRERREHRADDGHQQHVPAMAARAPRRHDAALRRHAADDDSLELERRAGGAEARLRASRHRGDQGLHGGQAQRRLAGVRDDGQSFAGLEPGALLVRGLAAGERALLTPTWTRRRSVAATGPRRTSSSSRRRACGTWSTRRGCLPTRPAPTRAIHARGRRRGIS